MQGSKTAKESRVTLRVKLITALQFPSFIVTVYSESAHNQRGVSFALASLMGGAYTVVTGYIELLSQHSLYQQVTKSQFEHMQKRKFIIKILGYLKESQVRDGPGAQSTVRNLGIPFQVLPVLLLCFPLSPWTGFLCCWFSWWNIAAKSFQAFYIIVKPPRGKGMFINSQTYREHLGCPCLNHMIIFGHCGQRVHMWNHIIGTWHLLLYLIDGSVQQNKEYLEKEC